MKCYKCNNKGSIKTDNKFFCNNCFNEIIEKRIRKEIRQSNLLSKNDKVLIIDDGTEKSAINKYILKKIIKDPTITFTIRKSIAKSEDYTKIVLPWVLDDEAINYLKTMFTENKTKTLVDTKMIKPLINITTKEAISFAKMHNLKFEKSKPLDKDLNAMIEKMEDKYPGTKFGILKTIKNLR